MKFPINFNYYLPSYKNRVQSIYSSQTKEQPGYDEQKFIPLVNLRFQDDDDKYYFQNNIPANEVNSFVGILFVNNLLSQVIHSHRTGSSGVRISDRLMCFQSSLEKKLLFPEIIKGILGNWNYHVCPSVLPLMYLYLEGRSEILNPVGHQNRSLARQAWIQHFDLFKSAVDWINESLSEYMQVLCGVQVTDDETKRIQALLLQHFSEIDVELRIFPDI